MANFTRLAAGPNYSKGKLQYEISTRVIPGWGDGGDEPRFRKNDATVEKGRRDEK